MQSDKELFLTFSHLNLFLKIICFYFCQNPLLIQCLILAGSIFGEQAGAYFMTTDKVGKEMSLTDLADELLDRFSIQLSKQSLAERYNCYGVKLMRSCFEAVFEKILGASNSEQKPDCVFGRVILRDATSFQLPAYLSSFYLGNAGDSTGSVLKIQTEYDLLSGRILRLDFRNGKENDSEWLNQKGVESVENDLHLMDLGYYKHGHLFQIALPPMYHTGVHLQKHPCTQT